MFLSRIEGKVKRKRKKRRGVKRKLKGNKERFRCGWYVRGKKEERRGGKENSSKG